MQRKMMIKDSLVVNFIKVHEGTTIDGYELADAVDGSRIGDGYVDGALVPQDPSIKEKEKAKIELSESDADMAQIIDVLIDALDSKNILKKVDLPQSVQDVLSQRKELRDKINSNGN